MFKNALFFRITETLSAETLNENLEKMRFRDIGSMDVKSIGFEPLADDLELIHQVGDICVGTVRVDSKSIPGSALKQLIKARSAKIEAQQGFPPGRKQKREIKEQIIDEQLPKILPTTKRINFMIFSDLLVVDTSSGAAADMLIELISKCIDPFTVVFLTTEMSPAAAMTEWLLSDEAPTNFTIDQEVEMKSSSETKASVRWLNESANIDQAREHFAQGKLCIKMAMTYSDRMSFALNDKGIITRVKPLDVLITSESDSMDDDQADRLDGEIALIGGEIYKMITELVEGLGGEVQR